MRVTASTLRTPRLTFGVRSAGQGELVLFLHGITAGAVVWDPVLEDLGRDFRCVAIDQRGHGLSDKPASGYGAADYVADVAAVLDALGPARAVVGHSLGARNAILAGAAMPERIGAVVAVDYAAGIEPEVFERLRASRSGGDGALGSADDVRRVVRSRSPLLPAAAVERRVAHLYALADGASARDGGFSTFTDSSSPRADAGFAPLAASWAMDQTVAAMDVDLTAPLRESSVPTLIVRGGDSPFLTEDALATSLALRDSVQGAVVGGTDHFVPEEAPAELSALVRSFLA